MDCKDFKNNISQKVGAIILDELEIEHLESCSDCQAFYEPLAAFENDLNSLKLKPLSTIEFAMVQQKLDESINQYQRRAVTFYNLLTRYGAGLATVMFLFFVSLWSGLDYDVQYVDSNLLYDSYEYAYIDTDEDETMNDDYVEILLNDYTQNIGFDSGELLLGELTPDEFDYLANSLDIGEIL